MRSADELQIKMAQGAKPGEGGHLPGHKVDAVIARLRHAAPGTELVSPPPHHDIYSIEDLAQLIGDLRAVNPAAEISVKLVSEAGVGTVAAGVAKAGADAVLISGGSGGTGAAPLGSIKRAGLPWELGLAEAQQVLALNDLHGRVRLEVDGQLMTGRDVIVAGLLGAERFGFGTAALVSLGCVLMRVCHKNTCPVGVATQDPQLRAHFAGEPEHVIAFMGVVARQVREEMARLGFRRFDELVGRADRLRPAADPAGLDLAPLCHVVDGERRFVAAPPRPGPSRLDLALLDAAAPAIARGERVAAVEAVDNRDRAVLARLSGEIVARHPAGLPDDTVEVELHGTAGQSFAAFLAPGVSVRLCGEANDAVGKGMAGGRIVLVPPDAAALPEASVILGNVALYGATGGTLFARGRAGERFAVRNSGAVAVVEGTGAHGCEYMTGGLVAVLGPVGRNFGAGMSGGAAFLLDPAPERLGSGVALAPLDPEDLEQLRALVVEHRERTGSSVAWRLLARWEREQRRFGKVVPQRRAAEPAPSHRAAEG
ncbi:MAG: glutamate synthase-related protein [Myxococcota bacterium]